MTTRDNYVRYQHEYNRGEAKRFIQRLEERGWAVSVRGTLCTILRKGRRSCEIVHGRGAIEVDLSTFHA